jgi:ankyrin repeat protein
MKNDLFGLVICVLLGIIGCTAKKNRVTKPKVKKKVLNKNKKIVKSFIKQIKFVKNKKIREWVGEKEIKLKSKTESSFFTRGYLVNKKGKKCEFRVPYIFNKPGKLVWKTKDYPGYEKSAWKICKKIDVTQKELKGSLNLFNKNSAPPLIILASLVGNIQGARMLIKTQNDSGLRWGIKNKKPGFCENSPLMKIIKLYGNEVFDYDYSKVLSKYQINGVACADYTFYGTPYTFSRSNGFRKFAEEIKKEKGISTTIPNSNRNGLKHFLYMPQYFEIAYEKPLNYLNLNMYGIVPDWPSSFYDDVQFGIGEYVRFFSENINKEIKYLTININNLKKPKIYEDLYLNLHFQFNYLNNNISKKFVDYKIDSEKTKKNIITGLILSGNPKKVKNHGYNLQKFCKRYLNLCKFSVGILIYDNKKEAAKYLTQKMQFLIDKNLIYVSSAHSENLKNFKILDKKTYKEKPDVIALYLALKGKNKQVVKYLSKQVNVIYDKISKKNIIEFYLKNKMFRIIKKILKKYDKDELGKYFSLYPSKQFWKIVKNKIKLTKKQKGIGLLNSCKTNSMWAMKYLIKLGANVNFSDGSSFQDSESEFKKKYFTPLLCAIKTNNIKMVKYLLKKKANPLFNPYGTIKTNPDAYVELNSLTSLFAAISANYFDILKLLIKHSKKVNYLSLYLAIVEHGPSKMRNFLAKKIVENKIWNSSIGEDLVWAIVNQNNGLAKYIINNMKNIRIQLNIPECCGSPYGSPEYFSVDNDNFEIFKYLIKKGANPFKLIKSYDDSVPEFGPAFNTIIGYRKVKYFKYLLKKFPKKGLIKKGFKIFINTYNSYDTGYDDSSINMLKFFLSQGVKLSKKDLIKLISFADSKIKNHAIKYSLKNKILNKKQIFKLIKKVIKKTGLDSVDKADSYSDYEQLFNFIKLGVPVKPNYFLGVKFKDLINIYPRIYELKNHRVLSFKIFKEAVLKNEFKKMNFILSQHEKISWEFVKYSVANPYIFKKLYNIVGKFKDNQLNEIFVEALEHKRKQVIDFVFGKIKKINSKTMKHIVYNYNLKLVKKVLKKYNEGSIPSAETFDMIQSGKVKNKKVLKFLSK